MSDDDPTSPLSDDLHMPIVDLAAERARRGLPPMVQAQPGVDRLLAVSKPWDACKHRETQCEERTRVVSCHTCGEQLDAFDVLWMYAIRERQLVYQQTGFLEQLDALAREVEHLKKERANLKAQVRRAKGEGR